jgi:crotonobetainyl-CoA:carnitine CoA-transferase CaiB-like acyl-CoA transferase
MWNRNKRALALDMSTPRAAEICRRLCEKADIVIDNFSIGVLERWGIGYESVKEGNPRIIYLSMSGMGESGAWSKYVTYAPTIHALSGLTHMTGVPGREDIGIGFSYSDHQAGMHGVVALLAALEARRISGRGQRIDMSQFEMGVNFSGPALLDLFANGRAAQPTGNRLPYDAAAPHNCYPCKGEERWVAISVMDDEQWRSFRLVMGDPEWARDDCYCNATGRIANLETLDAQVSAWTGTLRAERVQELCQAASVPAGVVQNGVDLAERDPQLRLRDFLIEIDDPHPGIGTTYADRLPLHFEKTPADVYRRPRVIGEDNRAVLGEWLGMTEDEVRGHEDDDTLR